jgi:hypothetical protein
MTWGRGQNAEQVERLAAAWNVRLFVAGHKHVEEGAEAPFARLLLLNSDHERAAVVPFDLSQPAPTAQDALLNAVPMAAIGAALDG